ncbi:MAG: hypothetical protein JWR19_786 [Pedosphaera sp.]|nr:hypothetical protein [Pedosphaera sp.]
MAYHNQNNDGPRPTLGPSPWLFLALTVFLAAGIRQTFYPGVKQVETTRSEQFFPAIQPSAPPTIVKSLYHHQTASFRTGNLLSDQLEKLIQDLHVEDDSIKREELIANFLATLKLEDVSAALDILKNTETSDLVGDLSRRLVQRWAEGNPQDLDAWAKSLPAGPQRQAALDGLAITWANSQLTNAISWGQSLADETERNRALVVVANEAVRVDPMVSLKLGVDLPPNSQRDEMIERAAMEWASRDAQNAVAWAVQIPDETLRAKVLAGEATAWADQDPESAATLAVTELPAGRLQQDTVISIVERWAQQQPETAAAWVEQFPEGALREAAIQNLIAQWSQKAPAEAQQWLARHS